MMKTTNEKRHNATSTNEQLAKFFKLFNKTMQQK